MSTRIVMIGECWGRGEDLTRTPFSGEAGKELWRMLGEAMPLVAPEEHVRVSGLLKYGLAWTKHRSTWLADAGIFLTNVVNKHPAENKFDEHFCVDKSGAGADYKLPPIDKGKYLKPELVETELPRLFNEINSHDPNIVVCLGNKACWAVLQATNISALRGTVAAAVAEQIRGRKVIATYHPSAVIRGRWDWRPIALADLMKANHEADFREIRRPKREIFINPSISEVEAWTRRVLEQPPQLLSIDIETKNQLITCIGFATAVDKAFVVPFAGGGQINSTASPSPGSYWQKRSEEYRAWICVKSLCESMIPKVFQNGVYDMQYLLRLGFRVENASEDTMLLHHSLFPEMQKGLGFLGSIYTSEPAWKLMRRKRADTVKADE
jgi:uracil-DNA glycosylase